MALGGELLVLKRLRLGGGVWRANYSKLVIFSLDS